MAKVRMNEASLRRIAGVQFRPGLQGVDPDGWEQVKSHPIGAKLIERGILEEVKGSKSGRPSADAVVDEIKETYDVEELKRHLEDGRKKVSEAAQAQIDKINSTAGE